MADDVPGKVLEYIGVKSLLNEKKGRNAAQVCYLKN